MKRLCTRRCLADIFYSFSQSNSSFRYPQQRIWLAPIGILVFVRKEVFYASICVLFYNYTIITLYFILLLVFTFVTCFVFMSSLCM